VTNSEPPSPRKPLLDLDEWVAIIVSFGAIAVILFIGMTRSDELLDPEKLPILGDPPTTEVEPPPVLPSPD
jgi:hypothetical protein